MKEYTMEDTDTQVVSPSLHDDLAENYSQMAAEEPVEVTETVTEEPSVEDSSDLRLRDDQGRFASKPEEEAVPATLEEQAPEMGEENAASEVISGEESETGTDEQLMAPQHWPAENKEAFDSQPREAQEFILRRMGEQDAAFTKKTMDLADERKFYESMQPVLQPLAQSAAQHGMNVPEAIGRLFRAQQMLEQNPVDALQKLAVSYGVDLNKQFGAQPEPSADFDEFDDYVDPQIAELQNSVNSRLDYLDNHIRSQQQQAAQQQQYAQRQQAQATQQTIEQFAMYTDENGTLAHPFYAEVEDTMIPLVHHIRQTQPGMSQSQVLDAAYEQAVYANPNTRVQMAAQASATTEAQAAAKRKADADKAKRAALPSLSAGDAGVVGEEGEMTLREELEANLKKMTG